MSPVRRILLFRNRYLYKPHLAWRFIHQLPFTLDLPRPNKHHDPDHHYSQFLGDKGCSLLMTLSIRTRLMVSVSKARLSCGINTGRNCDTGPLCKQGTMGTFPADALLEIFRFYIDQARVDGWQTLVHVCRRWRYVALGSPRHLKLYLYCKTTDRTSVRRMLDIWPPLPLVINTGVSWKHGSSDIIAALGHTDRIVEIHLSEVPSFIWKELLAAMQEPLPALTKLYLCWNVFPVETLPTSFLGGSAPQLQSLHLNRVSYSALPKLLSSARDLVDLHVSDLPDSGYISSEDMAACLSSMTRLTRLALVFKSEREPRSVARRSSKQERTVLHSLTHFYFRGATKYLEDFVARVDAPRLSNVVVTFIKPIVSADISQFSQFISQADNFKLFNEAEIFISDTTGSEVKLRLNVGGADETWCYLIIPCVSGWDGTPSTLAQVCVNSIGSSLSSSLPLCTLEHLIIRGYRDYWPTWGNRWLEFLHAFTAVKDLRLCDDVAPRLLPVLKDATREGTIKVLPALQNLFLEEYFSTRPRPTQEPMIKEFVTARRLAGSPVTVHRVKK